MAIVQLSNRAGLFALANLSDDEWRVLHSALLQVPPAEKDVASKVAAVLPLPGNNAKEIVSSLIALLAYQMQDVHLPKFVGDVITEMRAGGPSAVKVSAEKADVFGERITQVLKLEPMRVRSKAQGLIFESFQLFQSARVMTDIRPVFGGGRDLDVSGAIIKHDLKIEFFDREGYKHFFVTMDDGDIRSLKLTLDRAEKKAQALRSLLRKCQISDLNAGEPEGNA